jgi:hypothetical protein
MMSREIVAKRHLQALKTNSGGNRFKGYGKNGNISYPNSDNTWQQLVSPGNGAAALEI